MDYLKVYIRIIRRSKNRSLCGYIERHHIIPKSLGGSNNKYNIVELTAREHFISHMLLLKICEKYYGKSHNYTKKMIRALNRLITGKPSAKTPKYTRSSRVYQRIQQKHSKVKSKMFSGENNYFYKNSYWKGKKQTKEHINKRKRFGKDHHHFGKTGKNNPKSRKYKIIKSDGTEFIIYGINQYAKDNQYSQGALNSLLHGKIKRHKDIIGVVLLIT